MLRRAALVAGDAVVRQGLPGRRVGDVRVVLRPDPGVAVERAEADRDLRAVGPRAAEDARAAEGAEGLRGAALRIPGADQLLPLQQPEALARHAPLGQAVPAGVPAAAGAVARVRAQE